MLSLTGPAGALATSESTYSADGYLPAGWPNFDSAEYCVFQDSCIELEGEAFADVDISAAMANYEDSATFWVTNSLVDRTTLWFVCSYDADGRALQCFYDDERDWGMMGNLGPDARELRLFPVHSSPNSYHLDLDVD